MKTRTINFFLTVLCILLIQGCKKDKGNYDYNPVPGKVTITLSESSIMKVLGQDTIKINPVITYSGDTSDLSYEWQRWVVTDTYRGYRTFATGKNLSYKCGPDSVITASGNYSLRLAVVNKKLISSLSDNENQTYSSLISLSVVNSLYRGLMVLHGNAGKSDVGLIEHNMFLPLAGQTVNTRVMPGFYSYFNQGQKIDGEGKSIYKVGAIQSFGDFVFGTSNVYIFTDKVGLRTDYLTLKNTVLDYKALFSDPSAAPAKPDYFARAGNSTTALGMVSSGKVYYGFVVGALYNDQFEYNAAPFLSMVFRTNSSVYSSVGVVAFDNLSKAFMYSLYNPTATYIYKFPQSTLTSIPFNPANTNANLVYMDLRTTLSNIMAVMEDRSTSEKYLVEINPYVKDLSKAVGGRFSMSGLPAVSEAKFYAFGGDVNLNYYSTKNKIYQYLYRSGNTSNLIFSVPGNEEITMMKILKYQTPTSSANNTSLYQLSNQLMIVGTVDVQGRGKVYALKINLVTGALNLENTFNGTESGETSFGKIYDVDLKTQ